MLGFVVVSQTCDIQRAAAERPFVNLCAVHQCPEWTSIGDVKKGLRPRFAFVPGVALVGLVADLDQMMTIEKPLLTSPHNRRLVTMVKATIGTSRIADQKCVRPNSSNAPPQFWTQQSAAVRSCSPAKCIARPVVR